jgi:hypothetical protein
MTKPTEYIGSPVFMYIAQILLLFSTCTTLPTSRSGRQHMHLIISVFRGHDRNAVFALIQNVTDITVSVASMNTSYCQNVALEQTKDS